jgi:hypothetical protein
MRTPLFPVINGHEISRKKEKWGDCIVSQSEEF